MIPVNAGEIVNGPVLGLIALITMMIISLMGVVILANNRTLRNLTKLMIDQSESTSASLRDQVMRMQGQITELSNNLRNTTEDAIRAKLAAGEYKTLLDDAQRDKTEVEKKFQDLKRYVGRLVAIMREHKIPVPEPEDGTID